ncbi:MAG: T9SS type A sorting domain-containing protein, partial [Saprospiraceae bacterium]|nr:T9SS type A sorting domain-containing protein [Bacteroidia bacterium]NNL90746.1 T9SS type A sorting domain-containing protein [Saprospiraceae bacterium]
MIDFKANRFLRFYIFIIYISLGCNLFGQPCAEASLELREVKAIDTDENIRWEIQNHQVFINPECTPNDKLVVHLVGSFDNPASTTFFPTFAANQGFKAINLKYPNNASALGTCGSSPDADCFKKYREEIIFGRDESSEVAVDSFNCITFRLLKLLVYLHDLYPNENWNTFFTNNEIDWSKVILSGHSQGGGHAAFIGKQYITDRVLMFASPNDYSSFFDAPADWTTTVSATQDSNYFAFGNIFDDVVDFGKQYQIWENMNLDNLVDSIKVETSAPPYENTRILYTDDTSSSGFSGNHNAVIIDDFTPKENDRPLFIPVWKYMLGMESIISSDSNIENLEAEIKAYPNPSSGLLIIESQKKIVKVEVYSILGKLLKVDYPENSNFKMALSNFDGLLLINAT